MRIMKHQRASLVATQGLIFKDWHLPKMNLQCACHVLFLSIFCDEKTTFTLWTTQRSKLLTIMIRWFCVSATNTVECTATPGRAWQTILRRRNTEVVTVAWCPSGRFIWMLTLPGEVTWPADLIPISMCTNMLRYHLQKHTKIALIISSLLSSGPVAPVPMTCCTAPFAAKNGNATIRWDIR